MKRATPSEKFRAWLEKALRKRKPGEQLPYERELAAAWNLSISTVGMVLRSLAEAGRIDRIPGKGTFVAGTRRKPEAPRPPRGLAWKRLADALRASISNGDLKRGEALPSQKALCYRFHVSPNTVSKAFAKLQREGYVLKIGLRYWVGTPRLLVQPVARKEVFLFRVGAEDFSYLFSQYEMCQGVRAMERELLAHNVVIRFHRAGEFKPLARKWQRHGHFPQGLVFAVASRAWFEAFEPVIRRLLRKIGDRRLPVLLIGGFGKRLSGAITGLAEGSLHTMRARTIAEFLFERGIREATLFLDEAACGTYNLVFPLRVRQELLHLDPGFRFHGLVRPMPDAPRREEFARRFTDVLGSGTTGALAKYESVRADAILRDIHVASDFPEALAAFPESRAWLFREDRNAARALEWLEARGGKSPRDTLIIGMENDPRYYHLGISACVPNWERIGYLMAHALIGDIPVDKTRRGLIRMKMDLLERGTT
ncbi:MAG: GntR family transcriptional regulator [Kiritimatiellae bacterium]|nr:GntR family transcriptional regulator [Kiritimatiellia bacterium]